MAETGWLLGFYVLPDQGADLACPGLLGFEISRPNLPGYAYLQA